MNLWIIVENTRRWSRKEKMSILGKLDLMNIDVFFFLRVDSHNLCLCVGEFLGSIYFLSDPWMYAGLMRREACASIQLEQIGDKTLFPFEESRKGSKESIEQSPSERTYSSIGGYVIPFDRLVFDGAIENLLKDLFWCPMKWIGTGQTRTDRQNDRRGISSIFYQK